MIKQPRRMAPLPHLCLRFANELNTTGEQSESLPSHVLMEHFISPCSCSLGLEGFKEVQMNKIFLNMGIASTMVIT